MNLCFCFFIFKHNKDTRKLLGSISQYLVINTPLSFLTGPVLCGLPPRQAPDSGMASQGLGCPDHLWSVWNVPSPPQAPGTPFRLGVGIRRHAWPASRSPFWPAAATCGSPQRHLVPCFLAMALAVFFDFKRATPVWSVTWGEAAGTRLESRWSI